jgi:hypothetical protein
MVIIKQHEAFKPIPLTIVLFGMPGIGKSSIAATSSRPSYLIDFDRGAHRASKIIRTTVAQPDSWPDFDKWRNGEEYKKMGLKSLVVDTVGAMLDDHVAPHLVSMGGLNKTKSGALSQSGWGQMGSLFSNFKASLASDNTDLVAICHAKEDVDDEGGRQYRLDVKGQTSGILMRKADMIGFMYYKQGDYYIDFAPQPWHVGKDMAGMGEVKIPPITSAAYSTFLADLIENCRKKITFLSEESIAFQNALSEWQAKFDGFTTPDEFTNVMVEIAAISDKLLKDMVGGFWSSTLKAKKFKYDSTAKQVVDTNPQTA